MLTAAQARLFEALARNRDFQDWLNATEAKTLQVLKRNGEPQMIYQAQGTCQFIDSVRALCEASLKSQPQG